MSNKLDNVEDIYELSSLQQQVLSHTAFSPGQQTAPGSVSRGNRPRGMIALWSYRIANIDSPAFVQAAQCVVDHHPELRISFLWAGLSKPVQIVQRRVALPVQELDWRGLSPAEQGPRLQAFLAECRKRPFSLVEAPLLRLAIIQVGEGACQHVWTHHPILLDSWSQSLFFQEVFRTYQAIRQDKEPVNPLQAGGLFRDYISWLQRQNRAAAESFFKQSLAGFNTPVSLGRKVQRGPGRMRPAKTPPGRGQPAPASSRSSLRAAQRIAVKRLILSPLLATALRNLAQRHGFTLHTLLLGAWGLLLARLSARKDVLFGATFSGKPTELAGMDSVLGLFSNILPIRVTVSPDQRLIEWLKEIQTHKEQTARFAWLPLEQVRAWSRMPPARRLFETVVADHHDMVEVGEQPWQKGMKTDPLRGIAQRGYPLVATLGGAKCALQIAYAAGRFDTNTIERMLREVRQTLATLTTDPDRTLESALQPRSSQSPPRGAAGVADALELLLGLCLGIMHGQEGTAAHDILVPLQPHGSRTPFFCVHPAGGTVLCYQPLARHFSQDQPFYGVQLPIGGQEGESTPVLTELVDRCVHAIRSVQPAGPYQLGGWSVGGTVAFVIAQRLREQGQQVALLALIEATRPEREASADHIKKAVLHLSRQFKLGIDLGFYLRLPAQEQTAYVMEKAQQGRGFAQVGSPEDVRQYARSFLTYLQAVREHTFQPWSGRVVLFRATENLAKDKGDPRLGWDQLAAEVEQHEVPGSHASMVRAPHAKHLVEKLMAFLAGTSPQSPGAEKEIVR